MSNNLCQACHLKPKYKDGTKTHPYCSRTCARNMCEFCHQRPKHTDGNTTHSYCSKTCAKAAGGIGGMPPKFLYGPTNDGCLLCGKASTKGPFCSRTCASTADNNAPQLIEVPSVHDIFKGVVNQFTSSWRHRTSCPTIRGVYKIVEDPSSVTNYENHRASVEAQGNFTASGHSTGNERRRWHGTKRECLLGENGNTNLCSSGSCSLCGIIRSSYKLNLFATNTGWGRFGKGIYTTSTSSKSNDYSKNVKSLPTKAIILNKVVVGKGYKMSQDDKKRTAPPQGYDSVIGEVVVGGRLNYDELVCYTEDAIRPSYLVVYDNPT